MIGQSSAQKRRTLYLTFGFLKRAKKKFTNSNRSVCKVHSKLDGFAGLRHLLGQGDKLPSLGFEHERRDANRQMMPKEVEEVYQPLYQEVCWLQAKWIVFRQLYSESPENVELMNASAPTFFRMYQDISTNDILLCISRLTDPQRTFKNDNLSLEQLVSRVDSQAHPILSTELTQLLSDAVNHCSFARTLRHKLLAHNDLASKLGGVNPLPTANLINIEAAMTAIKRIMNRVEQYFDNSPVMYDELALRDDGNTILNRLREAKKERDNRRSKRF